jgi:hypothetical protein
VTDPNLPGSISGTFMASGAMFAQAWPLDWRTTTVVCLAGAALAWTVAKLLWLVVRRCSGSSFIHAFPPWRVPWLVPVVTLLLAAVIAFRILGVDRILGFDRFFPREIFDKLAIALAGVAVVPVIQLCRAVPTTYYLLRRTLCLKEPPRSAWRAMKIVFAMPFRFPLRILSLPLILNAVRIGIEIRLLLPEPEPDARLRLMNLSRRLFSGEGQRLRMDYWKKLNEWREETTRTLLHLAWQESFRQQPVLEVDNVFILSSNKEAIDRYLDAVWSRKKAPFSPRDGFFCRVEVLDGFACPLHLLTGILARFEDDWQQLIGSFERAVTCEPVPRWQAFQTYIAQCWLLWGPSVPICTCSQWSPGFFLQYGFGDENNSVALYLPRGIESAPSLLRHLEGRAKSGTLALRARVQGKLRAAASIRQEVVGGAQRASLVAASRALILEYEAHQMLHGLDRYPGDGYYSSYIWAMYEIVDEKAAALTPPGRAWLRAIPFFEHGNLAHAGTFRFLKESLARKVVEFALLLGERHPGATLRFRSSLDESGCLYEGCKTLVCSEEPTIRSLVRREAEGLPREQREIVEAVLVDGGEVRRSGDARLTSCHLPDLIEEIYWTVAQNQRVFSGKEKAPESAVRQVLPDGIVTVKPSRAASRGHLLWLRGWRRSYRLLRRLPEPVGDDKRFRSRLECVWCLLIRHRRLARQRGWSLFDAVRFHIEKEILAPQDGARGSGDAGPKTARGSPPLIEAATCFTLTSKVNRRRIDAYFRALASVGARETPLRMWSRVRVRDGYIAGLQLIVGLLSRFDEDWPKLIASFETTLRLGRQSEWQPLQSFILHCWLLWGPSVPLGRCGRYGAAASSIGNTPAPVANGSRMVFLQYGFGDENNSLPLALPSLEMAHSLLEKLRGDAVDLRCIRAAVTGTLSWGGSLGSNEVCSAQESIRGRPETDGGKGAIEPLAFLEVEEASVAFRDVPLAAGYYSAYVWVIFAVEDEEETLGGGTSTFTAVDTTEANSPAAVLDGSAAIEVKPWLRWVPFFEHANLANPDVYGFLKKTLALKVIRFAEQHCVTDESGRRARLVYRCAFDDTGCKACAESGQALEPPGSSLAPSASTDSKTIRDWVEMLLGEKKAALRAAEARRSEGSGAQSHEGRSSPELEPTPRERLQRLEAVALEEHNDHCFACALGKSVEAMLDSTAQDSAMLATGIYRSLDVIRQPQGDDTLVIRFEDSRKRNPENGSTSAPIARVRAVLQENSRHGTIESLEVLSSDWLGLDVETRLVAYSEVWLKSRALEKSNGKTKLERIEIHAAADSHLSPQFRRQARNWGYYPKDNGSADTALVKDLRTL